MTVCYNKFERYEVMISLKSTCKTEIVYFYTDEELLNFIERVKNDISCYDARRITTIRFEGLEDRSVR